MIKNKIYTLTVALVLYGIAATAQLILDLPIGICVLGLSILQY